jgi:predicted DNA-binding WGR domain protein
MKQYLEYTDGKSSKFWEITLDGKTFTVRYGKIGSEGQNQKKEFAAEDLAKKEAEKLLHEKLKKGYIKKNEEDVDLMGLSLRDAIESKNAKLVQKLLDNMEPDEKYGAVNEVISLVPHYSNTEILGILLGQELKPIADYHLEAALHNALYTDNNEMIKQLIAHGATCKNGDILIHTMKKDNPEALELLAGICKDMNTEYDRYHENSATPLVFAIQQGNIDYVKVLIEKGVTINLKCRCSMPLDFAIQQGNTEIIEYLKSKGARQFTDDDLNIYEAIEKDKYDLIKNLLQKTTESDRGWVLSYAANHGKIEAVEILLGISHSQKILNEALISSCSAGNGKLEIVKALLKAGADLRSTKKELMDWVKKKEYKDILDYLNSLSGEKGKEEEDSEVQTEKFMDQLYKEQLKYKLPYIQLNIDVEDRDNIDPLSGFIGGTLPSGRFYYS